MITAPTVPLILIQKMSLPSDIKKSIYPPAAKVTQNGAPIFFVAVVGLALVGEVAVVMTDTGVETSPPAFII